MSRCFPYIPQGFTHQSAKNESLIGSIKLQTEKEKEIKKRETKDERKERKEKRKERKQERKERKEKRNERKEKKDEINLKMGKSDVLKDHSVLKTCLDPKDELFFQKGKESKSDLIEQSSLTEEHGHPISLPAPSSSYDSTENSNKRKRQTSVLDGSRGHGKILLRLPSRRESEFHSLANGQQSCSISRQTDCSAQHRDDKGFIREPKSINVEICSTSGRSADLFAPGKTAERRKPNAVLSPMQELESQYNFLLDRCLPPRLEDASSICPVDNDWLFQGQVERAEKRQRQGSESMSCSTVWARAEYLHEVDAYALPYVIPY